MRAIFILYLVSAVMFSQDWNLIGPDSSAVNDYLNPYTPTYLEVLAKDDGLAIVREFAWIQYDFDLPVKKISMLDDENIILIAGNGTNSDGIYLFNLAENSFQLVSYCLNPNFLEFEDSDSSYYVGSDIGLTQIYKEKDSLLVEPITFFSDIVCIDMALYNSQKIVSTPLGNYRNDGISASWEKLAFSLHVSDLFFTNEGVLYAFHRGASRSAGLFFSTDYGDTWHFEDSPLNLSAIYQYGDRIVLGFDKLSSENRTFVGLFNPQTKNLQFLKGLPEAGINRFTENMFIDCPNLIVCTDSGTYQTCSIQIAEISVVPDTLHFLNDEIPNEGSIIRNIGNVPISLDSVNITLHLYWTDLPDSSLLLNPSDSVKLNVHLLLPAYLIEGEDPIIDTLFLYSSYEDNIYINQIILALKPEIVSVETSGEFPLNFSLSQNYPNPFNPLTTIEYSIPNVETLHATSVQLKIYNLLGQEVVTLVNEIQPPGNYKVAFDASQLPSGVYLYRLKAGEYSQTRKMVYLR